MSDTPAWLTVAVALISSGAAIVGSVYSTIRTTNSADGRQRDQLEYQHSLETRKMLYERRAILYGEISETLDKIDSTYALIHGTYLLAQDGIEQILYYKTFDVIDQLDELGRALITHSRSALIIAPIDVCEIIHAIGRDTREVRDLIRQHHEERTWTRLRLTKTRDFLVRLHAQCLDFMARDLGVERNKTTIEAVAAPKVMDIQDLVAPEDPENPRVTLYEDN
jgi:hypothetical protein